MKNMYEITVRFYPTEDMNDCISIRRMVSADEVKLAKSVDPRKYLFVDCINRLDSAIKTPSKLSNDKFCPCGNDPVDCWYCEDAAYKAEHGGKSQWK